MNTRFVLILLFAVTAAHGTQLRSPWNGQKITPTDTPYACPAPPAFSQTLDLQAYYIDKHASVIDPQKLAAFQSASNAPVKLGQFASAAADAYLSKGSRTAAACVYSLLDAAAQAKAWTAKMPKFQDVYMQNWELSGTAIAYLKVRESGVGTHAQDAEIQNWFNRLAACVKEYFDASKLHPGSDAFNNHLYWAGLSLAAAGVASNDKSNFQWGIATYRAGLNAIQPDGSLVAEMARGQMALHYHLYAVGPLIMLAEFGESNGLDLYAEDQGAIHRLVKFCIADLEDPTLLKKRTAVPQVVSNPPAGLDIGWAVPYVHRFPNQQLSALIAKASWVNFWQWGGAPPEGN